MSRLTRIVARAALTAVSIGVAGVGAEFSFRVLLERRYAADAADFEHFLYERDPAGEHLYRPRQGVERENEIAGTGGVTWSYRIDERGFRSGPPRSANEDATRVVALGDSYTFGWAVEDAEAYPSALARELDASADSVEVINAGVPGFNTVQALSYLRERWNDLDPDVVVLGFVMNDAEPPRIAPIPPKIRYRYAPLWLLEDVKLWVDPSGTRLRSLLPRRRSYVDQFAEGTPERRACEEAFADLVELCGQRGVPLLVYVFPDVTQFRPAGYSYRPIHELVLTWGERYGVPTVDLLPLLEGRSRDELWVPGDGHPNAESLASMAERIAEDLRVLLNR
ncbi:MAG: GDSL-type esterase/lipase family protein [Planctomycetota bacterium]